MTLTTQRDLARHAVDAIPGAPPAEFTVAPTNADEVMSILSLASAHRLTVLVGWRHPPGIWISGRSRRRPLHPAAGGVVDWEPDDLTVVVAGGTRVDQLEHVLAERGQSAVLLEEEGPATVGGVVAAGASGWRRSRYGPVRDRLLEVSLVTGDGRPVRAGGRVVKNVTGFDLCRLTAGSFGRLGVVVEVCLKLWPTGGPRRRCGSTAEDALARAHRPLAVIEENGPATSLPPGHSG